MSYLSPAEIVPAVGDATVAKSRLPLPRLLLLAFYGGAYIALGGLIAVFVGGGFPGISATNPALPKLLMGATFPVGLMLVAIAGGELFTGNVAYFAAGVTLGRVQIRDLMRNWAWVYFGNFVGALFVAGVLVAGTGLLAPSPWREYLSHLAEVKTTAPFLVIFAKAIGCNWLVSLAMWQAYAAKDIAGKVLAIWFPIFAFVALGFEHCVANMFFVPAAMLQGAAIPWDRFLLGNLLPATLGNLVGGGLLVGVGYAVAYPKPGVEPAPFRELESRPPAHV